MNRPSLRALAAALALALGAVACSKSGGALLVVKVTAPVSLSDVRRFEVTVSSMTDGHTKQAELTYLAPDGGISVASAPEVSLGVALPGDVGMVMVAVSAFGGGTVPLATGAGGPVAMHAGERSDVGVMLGAPGDGGADDGKAGGGGAAGSGKGGAGQGGAGQGGAGQGGAGQGGGGGQAGGAGQGGGSGQAAGAGGGGGGGKAGTGGAGGACSPNLDTDTHHCGSCDHDCVFGTCTGGVCQKDLFAPGASRVVGDPTNLYWVNENAVWQRRLDESDQARKVSANVGPVTALTVNGSYIYYGTTMAGTDTGSVVRIPAGGGQAVPIATNQTAVTLITFLDTRVYWVARSGGADIVMRAEMDGTGQKMLGTSTEILTSLAVTLSYIYLATPDAINVLNQSPPTGAGSVIPVFSGQVNPSSIYTDGSNLYWINGGGAAGQGSVMKSRGSGIGSATPLQSGINVPTYMASDGVSLYYTDADRRLVKVPIDGSTIVARPLTTALAAGIYVDGTAIYWIGDSSVYRLAKF